jgi:hypothetical protein
MRTSLQDVRSLPDPLQSFNWDVVIANMPGTPDSREFTFKAQSTSIPGFLLEQVPVTLHGVELRYAGRQNYSHSFNCVLIETRDVGTRDMLRRWQKMARDWQSNSGSYKEDYSTTIELILYDDVPNEVQTIRLIGCWPESVDDSQLDSSSSAAVTTSVTFSYDFIDEDNGE